MSDDHLVGELNGEELSTDPGFGGRESPIDEDVGGEYMSDDIFLDHDGEYSFVDPLFSELNEKELSVDSFVQDGEYSSDDHLVGELNGEELSADPGFGGRESPIDQDIGGEYSFVEPLVSELNQKKLSVDSVIQDGEYSSVNPLVHDGEYLSDDNLVSRRAQRRRTVCRSLGPRWRIGLV